jgi:hypothetical protein
MGDEFGSNWEKTVGLLVVSARTLITYKHAYTSKLFITITFRGKYSIILMLYLLRKIVFAFYFVVILGYFSTLLLDA